MSKKKPNGLQEIMEELESSLLFRTLYMNNKDAVFILRAERNEFIGANQALSHLLGFTIDEILQKSPLDLTAEKHHDRLVECHETLEKQEFCQFELELLDDSKRGILCEMSAYVVMRSPEVIMLNIARDIRDEKEAEAALRQSISDYRGIFEYAHDAIIIFDPETEEVLDINRQATEMYGFTKEEFVGMSLEWLSTDTERGKKNIASTLKNGENLRIETRTYSQRGTSYPG